MGIVDYARPTMLAEVELKSLHYAMLRKEYSKAMEHALNALVEARLAYHAIRVQKEKEESLV